MEERIKVFLLETGIVLSQEPVSGAGLIRFGFSFFWGWSFGFSIPPPKNTQSIIHRGFSLNLSCFTLSVCFYFFLSVCACLEEHMFPLA